MRRFLVLHFLTTFLLAVSEGLYCLTCSDETCSNADQWVAEQCPPEIKYCYMFVNTHDRVYGLGCSAHEQCHQVPGYVKDTHCDTCSSNACNANRWLRTPTHAPPPGGATRSTSTITITLLVSFVHMLMMR